MVEKASLARPVMLLSAAGFVSVATMRVADPLVPQVAEEFAVSVGDASLIATTFTFAYGLAQLLWGALGDRFGKFRLVALASLVSALTVTSAAFADSLTMLGVARLAGGATAAAIVPLSMAFVGDHVAYGERQAMLARFLTGTLMGMVSGQILGGLLGDLFGWRTVFFVFGGLFAAVGLLLLAEQAAGRVPPPVLGGSIGLRAIGVGYRGLLARPWARTVLLTVLLEGAVFYGAFTFVGAHLRASFGLDYTIVGLFLGAFAIGGLTYTLTTRHLVRRLGERGLALAGGAILGVAFVALALGPLAAMPAAMALVGLGYYMLHATLQTHATQMAPEARGLAVSTFASALFFGQAGGIWLAALMVDRFGFAPVFIGAGALLVLIGAAFAHRLARRPTAG